MSLDNRVNISIVILGSYQCGKSSIVERWIRPSVRPHADETLAIEVLSNAIRLNDHVYLVRLWDTSGREMYEPLLSKYIYNADCVVLVYDVTDNNSWLKMQKWIEIIKRDHSDNIPICIIGNKIDKESIRRIHKHDVHTFIRTCGMTNIIQGECSAYTGENCFSLYQMVIHYSKKPSIKTWTSLYNKKESNCLIV
jgi:small GTP-binding protein